MYRRDQLSTAPCRTRYQDAPFTCDPKCRAEQRPGCRRPQNDHQLWPQSVELTLQPGLAGCYLIGIGRLVDTPFGGGRSGELEVQDAIRDPHVVTIDACLFERSIEQFSCWSDEGLPSTLLDITGLLPDDHHASVVGPGTEDGPRTIFRQVTPAARRKRCA
jgi:hypothetical protein